WAKSSRRCRKRSRSVQPALPLWGRGFFAACADEWYHVFLQFGQTFVEYYQFYGKRETLFQTVWNRLTSLFPKITVGPEKPAPLWDAGQGTINDQNRSKKEGIVL